MNDEARDAPSEARQLLPCGICGESTEYRCADCLMETGQSTPVCPKTECCDQHEAAEAVIHGKPSIDQLERILDQDADEAIHVLPNGEIRASGQKRSKVLTFREDLGGEYTQPAAPDASEPCRWCGDTKQVAPQGHPELAKPCPACVTGSAEPPLTGAELDELIMDELRDRFAVPEPPEPPSEKCPRCHGTGRPLPAEIALTVCPDCKGTGHRRHEPPSEKCPHGESGWCAECSWVGTGQRRVDPDGPAVETDGTFEAWWRDHIREHYPDLAARGADDNAAGAWLPEGYKFAKAAYAAARTGEADLSIEQAVEVLNERKYGGESVWTPDGDSVEVSILHGGRRYQRMSNFTALAVAEKYLRAQLKPLTPREAGMIAAGNDYREAHFRWTDTPSTGDIQQTEHNMRTARKVYALAALADDTAEEVK